MMDTQQTSTAIESALATLQPLRDLSRNWDVDIASCLEEYLQELTGLSGSQLQDIESPGETIPNFAHAALILQNSSNVYSRKVEYLHGLVYKALYEFFQTTTSKESRRKSADASIDDFYDFDPNEDFLLLDDVVPEDVSNTKINLKEDEHESNNLSGTPLNQSLTRTRLSLGGLSITRAERSSVGGGYFTSSTQQRALLSTLNNGSLRLVDGLCDVGEDGILLMPGSQSAPLTTAIGIESEEPVHGGRNLFNDEDPKVPVGDGDDHSNDGPGFDMHDDQDYEERAPVADQSEVLVDVATTQHALRDVPKRVTFAENVEPRQRTDPWALLDPHSNRGFTPKPLRKGKTYRLPEGITLPPSECVTGASTRRLVNRVRDSQKDEAYTPIIIQTLQAFLGKRQEFPKIPMDGLVFGDEFLYLAKEAAKVKAAKRRDGKKKLLEQQPHVVQEDEDDDDDDDNYGGGYGFSGDDDNDDNHSMGNAGVASMDEAYQGDRSAPGESNFGKTFEELCRAHIQAFAKGAEEFAFSTKLTDRVAKWQAKLAPILEEEERRAEFDIQKYSTSLLESAKHGLQRMKRKSDGTEHAATKTVEFASLAKNCTQSDVCRLFLASLTLANSGNICINEGAPSYSFEVISSHVERPMETYKAPSLAEQA